MWPRDAVGGFGMASNVAATRGGLNGFIAFMRRADAAKAMEQCDGKEWGGSVLTLGWGKAMALPPRPAFVVDSPYQRSARSPSPDYSNKRSRRSPSPDRRYGPRNGDDRKRNRRSRSRSIDRHRSGRRSRSRSRSFSDDGRGYRRSRSPPPRERRWPKLDNEEQIYLLEGVARKIQQHGKRFEETLRDKEKRNPTYDFLRNESLPAYHYFRMLLDSRYRAPSPPPPAFEEDGEMSVVTSDDSQYEDEMKKGKKGALGRLPRRKLESMLRNLTNTRDKIARIMVFALDRPDAAEEVVDVLIQSLIIPETPVPRKLARLNAISDILHNCAGVPTNAWKYRSIFEARLPAVFDHFGEIHRSFPGRMKAEIFRKQVMTVVQVWEDWLVFTPAVLSDFEARLSAGSDDGARADADDGMPLGASEPEVKIEPKVKPSAAPTPVKAIKPGFKPAGFVKIGTVDPAPKVEDDVDGDAMDLDGDSVDGDDIDGMPVA